MMKNLVKSWSLTLCNWILKNQPGLTEQKRQEVEYGAYYVVSSLIKLPFLYLPAIALGIFPEMLLTVFSFQMARFLAGGVHFKSHEGCSTIGNFVMGYLPLIVHYSITYTNVSMYSNIILSIVSLLIIYRYAPADLKSKPVHKEKHRSGLHTKSVIVYSIVCVASVYWANVISSLVLSAIFVEALTILPITYKLLKCNVGTGWGVLGTRKIEV